MDAFQEIYVRAQLALELDEHLRTVNGMTRTPKLASLTKAYDQLIDNVEKDAEKAHNQIAGTEVRRSTVMANVAANIGAVKAGLEDINSAFDSLMGDNGPPTSEGSAASQPSSEGAAENPTQPQS